LTDISPLVTIDPWLRSEGRARQGLDGDREALVCPVQWEAFDRLMLPPSRAAGGCGDFILSLSSNRAFMNLRERPGAIGLGDPHFLRIERTLVPA